MMEYKPKTDGIMFNMILSVLFVAVILVFIGRSNSLLITITIVLGYFIISLFFFKKRVTRIKIDNVNKTVFISYLRYVLVRKDLEYGFDGLKVTYKVQTGPRGIKRKELRFYNLKDKLIIKIIPNYEGWSANDAEMIYNELENNSLQNVENSPQ